MPIPRDNFHKIFIQEGGKFYDSLWEIKNIEHFNHWISLEFNEVSIINSYDEVTPNPDLLNALRENGYIHREAQCHYNAKAAAILNDELCYYTGFILRDEWEHEIITHSFNTKDNEIIDLSRLDNSFQIIIPINKTFPHKYCGVKIPNDFVRRFKNETLVDTYSMKPLLFEWYQELYG